MNPTATNITTATTPASTTTASSTTATTTVVTTTTTSTSRGRPVCEEFEEEVMAECESSLENNTYTGKKASAGNEFSYCLVKVSDYYCLSHMYHS